MASIEALPLDLVHEIIGYLDISSTFALKSAHPKMHHFIRFGDIPSAKRAEFLQAAECFPQNKELLSCFHCCKLLPKASFGMSQRKGSRGKLSGRPVLDRFCLDCGAQKRLYGHMNPIIIRKSEDRWLLCHHCGRYGTRSRQCGFGKGRKRQHADGNEWACWAEDNYGAPALDAMPPELLDQIVSRLTYKDAIQLSSTSLALRKLVNLNRVPIHDRFRFVC
ncbi:hypothetical protein Micbo1qcDRAFT_167308, partial [Microdochium bolleyi]